MTLQECYDEMGANYAGALKRFKKEERVRKYVLKFADGMDLEKIEAALEQKDYEGAFRYVHNLKGNALNLDLTSLYKVSDVLCEELRGGMPSQDVIPMYEQLKEECMRVLGLIGQIKA